MKFLMVKECITKSSTLYSGVYCSFCSCSMCAKYSYNTHIPSKLNICNDFLTSNVLFLFEYQLMVLPIEVGPKMAGLVLQLAAWRGRDGHRTVGSANQGGWMWWHGGWSCSTFTSMSYNCRYSMCAEWNSQPHLNYRQNNGVVSNFHFISYI